jgi:pyruvate dehydrogenase E2 component (dihydrolipoamide acetyltransferase)
LGISRSCWENIYDEKTKTQSPRYIMPFSLSYDHRVVDGAAGSAFTSKFAKVLSDISTFQES